MNTTLATDPSAHFWDKIAPKYARQPIKDPTAYAAKLDAIRAVIKPTDNMLEIGCGTGSTALRLARSLAHYTATDCSQAMISIAEDKRQAAGANNIRFAVADASKPISGAPFDVIAAFSLLHLVADVPAVLRALHDQLKPGGLFLSKTVCMNDTNIGIRAFVRLLSAVGVAPRVTFLSSAQLQMAMIEAGFTIETRKFFGSGRMNPYFVARKPV